MFFAAIWTDIEPIMGVMSACLGFLASSIWGKLGQTLKIMTSWSSLSAWPLFRFRASKESSSPDESSKRRHRHIIRDEHGVSSRGTLRDDLELGKVGKYHELGSNVLEA